MFGVSGGSKSRLAKAAGAEPSGEVRDQKLHTVVGQSASRSQRQKHLMLGARLEVQMSKKCTPLWCEAFRSQSVKSRPRSDHCWAFNRTTRHETRRHDNNNNSNNNNKNKKVNKVISNNNSNNNNSYSYCYNHSYNYTKLHYTYATLHKTTLHCTTLQCTTLHYTMIRHSTLHNKTTQYNYNYNYHYNYNCYSNSCNTTTTTTAIRYTTLHPAVVGEVTTATNPRKQLQPPFGPSVGSLCHPCITTTHLSYSFLSLKFPPAPCAVLLVIRKETSPIQSWKHVPIFCGVAMIGIHFRKKTVPMKFWNCWQI